LIKNYGRILTLMSPFIPHISSECLSNIDQKTSKWPVVSKEDLIEENVNFVVQINGKKRALLNVKRDVDEKTILKEVHENKETEKFLQNQKIVKIIFIPNRLINIIL
jgi:leucyl-tRNA synthetase